MSKEPRALFHPNDLNRLALYWVFFLPCGSEALVPICSSVSENFNIPFSTLPSITGFVANGDVETIYTSDT